MSKRCLVTGGAGFVGSHIARRLAADGHQVDIVDNADWDWSRLSGDGGFLHEEYQNDIIRFLSSHRNSWDWIFHCAAVVGGRQTIEGDPLAVAANFAIDSAFFRWLGKINSVESARKPERVVYFSSSSIYPINLQGPRSRKLIETDVLSDHKFISPDEIYGWSKAIGEILAQRAVKQYNVPVVIYRPFSGYGEDQSLDYPFPSIVQRVARGDNPVEVWGTGEQVRDFIHIDDVVGAVMASFTVLEPGEVMNIGSGIPKSFIDLIGESVRVLRGHICFNIDRKPTKPSGVYYRVANTTKMWRYYEPKISLREGIERVANALLTT